MDSVSSDAQVHFLVFREGENINVVKFIERADGVMTPLSKLVSQLFKPNFLNHVNKVNINRCPASSNSHCVEDLSESIRLQKLSENNTTREKMNLIRNQMAAITQGQSRREPSKRVSVISCLRMRSKHMYEVIFNFVIQISKSKSVMEEKFRQSKSKEGKSGRDVQLPPLKNGHQSAKKGSSPDVTNEGANRAERQRNRNRSQIPSVCRKKRQYSSRPNTLFSDASRRTMGSRMNELGQVFKSEHESKHNIRQNLKSSWTDESTAAQHSRSGNALIDSLNGLNLNIAGGENPKLDSFNMKQPLPDIRANDAVETGPEVQAFMFNMINQTFSPDGDLSSSAKWEPAEPTV